MATMKQNHLTNSHEFRRGNERKIYNQEIMFSHSSAVYRGMMKNISLGGAHIESNYTRNFFIGDIVVLSIPYTSGQKNIKRKGRIVWINETGFSIEFFAGI